MFICLKIKKSYQLKRKPLIYLYSDTEINASIKLDPYGEFTFTYPEYKDGWDVLVKGNGLIETDERIYPYLFWEATSINLIYSTNETGYEIPGFMIKSDTATSFLQQSLESCGLNQTEITDFITYWGPILKKKEYAFIQFIFDDEYDDKIAKLDIIPRPESSRRIYILCSNLDEATIGMGVVPQMFSSFERNGFTLVEWGGTILTINNL